MVRTRGGIRRRGHFYPPRSRSVSAAPSSQHDRSRHSSPLTPLSTDDEPDPGGNIDNQGALDGFFMHTSHCSDSQFPCETDVTTPLAVQNTKIHARELQPNCFMFRLPDEIIDIILNQQLSPSDHLALALTCKSLRRVYTHDVLHALRKPDLRETSAEYLRSHLWSSHMKRKYRTSLTGLDEGLIHCLDAHAISASLVAPNFPLTAHTAECQSIKPTHSPADKGASIDNYQKAESVLGTTVLQVPAEQFLRGHKAYYWEGQSAYSTV